MKKTIYCFMILSFVVSSLTYATTNSSSEVNIDKKVGLISSLLSDQLDDKFFKVSPPKTKNGFTTIKISPELGENYKKKLHLWLHDSAKIDSNFKNVHIAWMHKSLLKSKKRIFYIFSFCLLLLTLLYYFLKFLSFKDMYSIEDTEPISTLGNNNNITSIYTSSDEDSVRNKVEQQVLKQVIKSKNKDRQSNI